MVACLSSWLMQVLEDSDECSLPHTTRLCATNVGRTDRSKFLFVCFSQKGDWDCERSVTVGMFLIPTGTFRGLVFDTYWYFPGARFETLMDLCARCALSHEAKTYVASFCMAMF